MFEMPKPLKKHNAELLDPYEEVAFHLKDGQCIQLQIFRDIDTDVELVQCSLCGLFFTLTKQRLPMLQCIWRVTEVSETVIRRRRGPATLLQLRKDVYSNVSTISRIDCLIGCHIGGYQPIYQQGPQVHVGVT